MFSGIFNFNLFGRTSSPSSRSLQHLRDSRQRSNSHFPTKKSSTAVSESLMRGSVTVQDLARLVSPSASSASLSTLLNNNDVGYRRFQGNRDNVFKSCRSLSEVAGFYSEPENLKEVLKSTDRFCKEVSRVLDEKRFSDENKSEVIADLVELAVTCSNYLKEGHLAQDRFSRVVTIIASSNLGKQFKKDLYQLAIFLSKPVNTPAMDKAMFSAISRNFKGGCYE